MQGLVYLAVSLQGSNVRKKGFCIVHGVREESEQVHQHD